MPTAAADTAVCSQASALHQRVWATMFSMWAGTTSGAFIPAMISQNCIQITFTPTITLFTMWILGLLILMNCWWKPQWRALVIRLLGRSVMPSGWSQGHRTTKQSNSASSLSLSQMTFGPASHIRWEKLLLKGSHGLLESRSQHTVDVLSICFQANMWDKGGNLVCAESDVWIRNDGQEALW